MPKNETGAPDLLVVGGGAAGLMAAGAAVRRGGTVTVLESKGSASGSDEPF